MMQNQATQVSKSQRIDRRLHIFLTLSLAIFSIFVFRLWSLQIYQQEQFELLAKNNSIRQVIVPSQRGKILDRNGKVLAEDVNYWDVWVPISNWRRTITDEVSQTLQLLSEILDEPYATLERRYKTGRRDENYKHERILIKERIPFDQYREIEERRIEFPKEAMVFTQEMPTRHYRYGSSAAHVLGHTGQITAEELKKERYANYSRRDRVGKTGIEYQYEKYLRGEDGVREIFVDTHEIQRGIAREVKKTVSGNNVRLNIDMELQQAAESILGASKGAIIVSDPQNSILALVSSPRFDPNRYREDFDKNLLAPDNPLYHRAIATGHPPGSVFKIFEVFGFLENLGIDPSHQVFCSGRFYLPGVRRPWRCHKRSGHGDMDLIQAISKSCDVYFYEMGKRLGLERISTTAVDFGLNKRTGIDLPSEKYYPFPSRATHPDWTKGKTINLSIGQGEMRSTPIQINTALAAIVNNGTLYQPLVGREIIFQDGNKQSIQPEITGTISAASETFAIVKKGMWEVCNDVIGGTGRRVYDQDPDNPWRYAMNEDFVIAGKTGTAQSGKIIVDGELVDKEPHAWFVCYGPYENPEIVITILVEFSGHGGEVAAPMAKKLIEVYRNRDKLKDLV